MNYSGKQIWEEKPDVAEPYRVRYVEGLHAFIERKNREGREERIGRMERISTDAEREEYRKQYLKMLGVDRIEPCDPMPERVSVGEDDVCKIYRLTVRITPEIPFYALFLIPHGARNAPLIVAQHGGGGTPELCSDFVGKNNYNHMVGRVLARGAVALCPQLLLWSRQEIETMRACKPDFNRIKIDNSLKRFGLSITGLETKGIMIALDYASTLDEVDEKRIGMIGLSYGGYYTLNTMAAEPRIKAGYSLAAFNSKDVYDWADWCYFGSALMFQDAELAALCAPRKLYVNVGTKDHVFDWKTAAEEASLAASYYQKQGFEGHFRFSVPDCGHTLPDDDEGLDFLFSALDE